jgi:TonB family protein
VNWVYNAVIITFFGIISSGWSQAQLIENEASTINPKDVKVVDYNELKYPHLAQRSQGVVVIRVKLNKSGQVMDAEALSGNGAFIADALANLKTWRFEPNAPRIAIVVYNFRVVQGKCKSASSFFVFDEPNLATINACVPNLLTEAVANNNAPQEKQMTVEDKELEVLNFEEMKYPEIARRANIHGLVLVQAKLDENGHVVETVPVFGHSLLIRDCLANLKKWRFRSSGKQSAMVVYRFIISFGVMSENQQQFVLYPPNFATITGPPMIATD